MIGVVSAESAEGSGGLAPREVRVPALSGWWVLTAGVTGLLASMALTVEKVRILLNPTYVPPCNINPIVSCGSVMTTPQASLLSFPNSLVGIAGFSAVVVTGVLTVSKVPLPQWYWISLAGGTLVGAGFVHWLIFQTLYRIGTLCPYCMVVWAATITLLVVVASIAFRPFLEGRTSQINVIARVFFHWRWPFAALWFTAVFLLIIVRFWNYWSMLFWASSRDR